MPTPTRRRTPKPEPSTEAPTLHGYVFLGIDPGLSGGMAVVTPDLEHAWPTPVTKDAKGRRQFDCERMVAMLRCLTITFAAIERVDAAPMRGRLSCE